MVCFPTYGGSGVVATELGIALAKRGHKVHFMSYSQPFRLNIFNQNLFYHEFSVNDYPLFEYQPYESAASKIVDVAMYEHLDILHVHYAIPHASVAYMAQQILLSKKIFLPYLTTLHGTDITLVGRDPAFEPVIRFSLNHSNAITSVSESLKKDTLNTFKIDNKISVVPNFINLSEYTDVKANCAKENYAPKGEKILVHVSNFRKVKRVEDVLHVFDKVRKTVPCKLILVEIILRSWIFSMFSILKLLGVCRDCRRRILAPGCMAIPSGSRSMWVAPFMANSTGYWISPKSTKPGGQFTRPWTTAI